MDLRGGARGRGTVAGATSALGVARSLWAASCRRRHTVWAAGTHGALDLLGWDSAEGSAHPAPCPSAPENTPDCPLATLSVESTPEERGRFTAPPERPNAPPSEPARPLERFTGAFPTRRR